VRHYDEDNLAEAIADVNIVVDVIGPAGHQFNEKLIRAMSTSSNVQVYFPSEFGVDHYIHDFPHREWDQKKQHFQLATRVISNARIFGPSAVSFSKRASGHGLGSTPEKGSTRV
jgi:hypothetical protein